MDDPTLLAEDSRSRLAVGTILAERYRIVALLGEGGMGAVYQAEHVHMQKTFAVKVLHAQMTELEEAVKRFEREAVAAGRIDHPNIATATDFGRLPNGAFYLVLEYIAGKNLREVLSEEGALPLERSLGIARQVALGLTAAHAANVVHRDLKPDNIMLVQREAGVESIKILDFGIAQVKGDEKNPAPVTQFGAIFGTPQYMAPEQAQGLPVDARVDLYALGLILDEMLRGKPTFEASDLMALLSKQLIEKPPPLPAGTPEAVSNLVTQLLEKNSADRLQSAEEVAARLDTLLGIRLPLLSVAQTQLGGSHSVVRRFLTGPSVRGVSRAQALGGALVLLVVALFVTGLCSSSKTSRTINTHAGPGQSSNRSAQPKMSTDPDDKSEAKNRKVAPDSQLDAKLERLVAQARDGNRTAVDALELRADDERSKSEWLGLAQGRLKLNQVANGLVALEHALDADGNQTLTPALLSTLRARAEEANDGAKILKFAAEHLKSDGADLLFHTWTSTPLVTDATRQAKDLLFSDSVKQNWSPALSIALDLRASTSCEESKNLLARAVEHADERSTKRLRDLKSETGCGANKKDDCYPCLRDVSERLDAAILQAQMKKAPAFDAGRQRRGIFSRWF